MRTSSNTVWRNFPLRLYSRVRRFSTLRRRNTLKQRPLSHKVSIGMQEVHKNVFLEILIFPVRYNLWHSTAVRLNCKSARHFTTVLRKPRRRSFGKRNRRKLLRWFEQRDVTQIIWCRHRLNSRESSNFCGFRNKYRGIHVVFDA